MGDKRKHGISLIEVLISASLFTIVILGISQSVLLMHRYSRANLCKYKAHLIATSYFESLLCDTHPYDLNKNTVTVRCINSPCSTFNFLYDVPTNETPYAKNGDNFTHMNRHTTSVYDDESNDLKVFMLLKVEESPLCKVYKKHENEDDSVDNSLERVYINPPEGFQSLRLAYWYTSPFMDSASNNKVEGSEAYLSGLECDELYAIRPLNPDDPEYDI
jgi:Tfp pilus assembly protein PilV